MQSSTKANLIKPTVVLKERVEKTTESKEETTVKEKKWANIDEFVRRLNDKFKPVIQPWPSWEVEKATMGAKSPEPQEEKPRNKEGMTEYEFYNEKIADCTEAIPELTPRHKWQVQAFVDKFAPLYPEEKPKMVAKVDIDGSSSSQASESDVDTESDEEGIAGIPEDVAAEVRANRKKIAGWVTSHKALYGWSQSHSAQEDAWEQLMAFDTSGSCILMMKDKKGNDIPVDITEGMKMANRSGFNAADEQMTVLTRCMSCDKRVVTGGDKAVLRDSEEGGQYQCKKCYVEEYECVHDCKLSNSKYKKIAMKTSGRSVMTVKKLAKSALFKITKDVYGKNSSEAGKR
jgi:hypothetical protein